MLRRGFGARRIGQALSAAGIAQETRAEVRASDAAQRRAALALAKRKRLGPFGPAELDRAARDKQIAAMLRAGHPFDFARALLAAPDGAAAEAWAGADDAEEGE